VSSSLIRLFATILFCLAASNAAQAEPCRYRSFEGASYIVCSFDPTKEDLRIFWRGNNGKPYRTFAALAADLEGKGKSLHPECPNLDRPRLGVSDGSRTWQTGMSRQNRRQD
jgi:uncharacterized protein YigE (DUF2233 family)